MSKSKTSNAFVVPQDLKDKWGSITSIATACNCLDIGTFQHKYATVVRESIAYLAKLHETLVEDALKHPQAHMIPELKEIITQMAEAKKEAKKNGKKADKSSVTIGSVNPTAVDTTDSESAGRAAHS